MTIRMQVFLRVFAVVIALGFAGTSTAESLNEVVVTATRTPTPIDDVLAPVMVITRDQLASNLSADVAELLRFYSGVELGRTGGIGQPTSIFIRGANSSHTLVLLDGIRINPGTFGTASLQNIPPSTIERIEIVKGPRSTLYGSDAIGGVINIITRKDVKPGQQAELQAGYGAYDTRQVSGAYADNLQSASFGANLSWLDSGGFPTRQGSSINSPYDNLAFGANMGADFGLVNATARIYQTKGTANYLGFTGPLDQNFLDRVTRADFSAQPSNAWHTRLVLSRMENSIEQNQSTDFLRTRRNTADWQNDLAWSKHNQLTFGAMYAQETAEASSFGAPYSLDTDILNLYVQDQLTLDAHALLLALGHTDYSTFGAHQTWNAEYSYSMTRDVRVVASLGTAFRAPSATDLYGFGGNPNLDPEASRNGELSLRYRIAAGQTLAFSAFQNDIDGLIAYDNAANQVLNIAQARIRGYELSYAYSGGGWRVHAEATYQNPRDRTTDQLLLRRAQKSITLGFSQVLGDSEIGFDTLWSGPRKDFGNVDLHSYVLSNMHARYTLSDTLSMLVQIENVFNTRYELASGYNTADRNTSVSLRYATH